MIRLTRVPLLNIDCGETADEPAVLVELAQLVHIACGGHAGDAASMDRVLAGCKRSGTLPGAHPAYADREGFGRRAVTVLPTILEDQLAAQCAALAARAKALGLAVLHAKPHGALYHAAHRDRREAGACVRGAVRALGPNVAIVGLPGGALEAAAHEAGVAFLREGFADRASRKDGTLIPRGEPGARIEDPELARARARKLALSGAVDTICVHADTPGAVAIARAVRAELDRVAHEGQA